MASAVRATGMSAWEFPDPGSLLAGSAPQQPRSQPNSQRSGYASGPGSMQAPADFNNKSGGGDVAGVHAVMLSSGSEYPVIDELPQVS